MADADGDLVVLLLDLALLRPDGPAAAALGLAPADLLSQLLAFTNAYVMVNSHNRLAVFAGQHNFCHLVHLGLGEDASNTAVFPAAELHAKITQLLQRCAAAAEAKAAAMDTSDTSASAATQAQPHAPATFALSGALSRALCLIHRLQSGRAGRPRGKPRLMVVTCCPDAPMQYIPVMNAIFSAQRADVTIDALLLAALDSSFLQQAAHLTGGLYFKPPNGQALLSYMLNYFACDTHTRSQLDVAQSLGVDFRASCFCHKFIIETGFVCSVCLSIFCQPSRACSTCGTVFAAGARQQQQQQAGAGAAAAAGGSGAGGAAAGAVHGTG